MHAHPPSHLSRGERGGLERANIRFFNSMSKFLLLYLKEKFHISLIFNTKYFQRQKNHTFFIFFLADSEKCRTFAGAKTEVP